MISSRLVVYLLVMFPPWIASAQTFTRADSLRGTLTALRDNYDVLFYHLDVEVLLKERSLKGSSLIRFRAKRMLSKLQIDLYDNMVIEKIVHQKRPLKYTREYHAVFIEFPEALPEGLATEITVYYSGCPQVPNPNIPMHGGFFWGEDEQHDPSIQVVCQGSGASLWWPNKDHLSDEPDSAKIWITVPAGLDNISNGKFVRKVTLSGKTRYEWEVHYPINNYNITLNIGKYVHRDTNLIRGMDTLALHYHVKPYHQPMLSELDKQVRAMLLVFERYFGKYPFSDDGFTVIESLYPMEHQSAVCIGGISSFDNEQLLHLLWHESAHEWWGNHVSCQDMADLWLHESFATYAESLMIESYEGKEAALDYINSLHQNVRHERPITGHHGVNDIFYQTEDLYSKGCLVLNTFRHVLDDDKTWFALLLAIQNRFSYQTISAQQLIQFINDFTKTDYNYFFELYLNHKSLPILQLNLTQQPNGLLLEYRWDTPVSNFRMPLTYHLAEERRGKLLPTSEWKKTLLKDVDLYEFEIDDDNFYFELHQTIKE